MRCFAVMPLVAACLSACANAIIGPVQHSCAANPIKGQGSGCEDGDGGGAGKGWKRGDANSQKGGSIGWSAGELLAEPGGWGAPGGLGAERGPRGVPPPR